MAPQLLRFFVRCLLGSLGIYACSWVLALGAALASSQALNSLGILVGYLSLYCTILSVSLLALYGVTNLLVLLASKLPAAAPQARELTEASAYALLGKSLTRYREKHYPDSPSTTLQLSLPAFEKTLQGKLPSSAHTNSGWWTAVSAHTQQWLAEGWQVTAVDLTAEEPTVTFAARPPIGKEPA